MKPVRTPSTTSTRISTKTSLNSVTSSQKKKNRSHFPTYYADLCQLQNIHPLTAVKQHLDKGVLDFVADRIKFEEWWTIINALSSDKTLHFIGIRSRHPTKFAIENMDTELKVRGLCKQPVIKTKFVLTWLMESLKICLAQSTSLTVLELEGLPLAGEYIASLSQGITQSTSIQHLSFNKSNIQDQGAEIICSAIKNLPSVVTLDLSSCGITETGTEIIAGLIKYQKLNRYSETWKQTLRYRDPDVEAMPGLRRITLNGNEEIRDTGAYHLVEEIKDDLWLRALDLQDCGLTDEGGRMLLDLTECNVNLVVVDARGNPFITESCLAEIMSRLATNNAGKEQSEYKWISKNPSIGKKSYMVGPSRPWTCQSSTLLCRNPAPSEYSIPASQKSGSVMRRSQSTLSQKDTLTWKGKLKGVNAEKSVMDLKTQQKLQEYEKMKVQLRDLTVMMNQEMQQRIKLIEENKELTEKLEQCQNEKKKLQEMHCNKLTIQNDTLQILDNIISRFGSYLKQEMDDVSEYSDLTQDETEIPEIMSNLKLILKKASEEQQEIRNDNKMCFKQKESINSNQEPVESDIGKEEDKKKWDRSWKANNRNDTIWEEEETVPHVESNEQKLKRKDGITKAQAMFARILGDSNVGKNAQKNMLNKVLVEVEDSEIGYSTDSDYEAKYPDVAERPLTSSDDFDSSS